MSEKDLGEINEKKEIPSGEKEPSGNNAVAYETYQRTLGQYKKSQGEIESLKKKIEELGEFKSKVDQLSEEKMKEEGNWKALLEQREAKLSEAHEKLNALVEENRSYKDTLTDTVKLSAFQNELGGKLKKKEYLNFIDTDKIAINPETNTVDEESLKSYAKEFQNNFKELISFDGKKLPNGAPNGSAKLTYEQWKALPSGKERKERLKDVMQSES